MRLDTTAIHDCHSLPAKAAMLILLLSLTITIHSSLSSVSAFSTVHPHGHHRHLYHSTTKNTVLQLSSMSERARATFDEFDRDSNGGMNNEELNEVLLSLDMDATEEEQRALFSYLDSDGDGQIDFEEFDAWYTIAVEAAQQTSDNFRQLLMSRRTVNAFDSAKVSDAVLRRAIECAIAAPNRSRSEPWRFIKVGSSTIKQLQELNERVVMAGGEKVTSKQQTYPLLPDEWTDIPGWCVVTSKVTPDDPETELKDFRSTFCAMQNFMLSMWSEGVGSKWTEGPTQKTQQFADLVGVDTSIEMVVGIIWYGFVAGGLSSVDPKEERKKDVDDVLSFVP